ncbi:MAG: hypothetical protein U0791_04265 [Gemmataceae bacterium]
MQKARRVVYGEAAMEGMVWAGEVLHAFKHDGFDAAWDRLAAWQNRWRTAKRAAADALLNHVDDRRETICYPDFWLLCSSHEGTDIRFRL